MPILEINNHKMYFEVHGEGPPALCMGGWGTYCHGNERHVGSYLLENYQVIIFDHRGLGESTDNETTPSMSLYAEDCAELLDHLNLSNVTVVGLVGMGACIGQELAINRPDLVKCLVNMNTWAKPDLLLRHQLETLREVHREMGWEAFQKLVCLWSFEENFYLENADRLLGPSGPWRELSGRFNAHARLIEACLSHDTVSRLNVDGRGDLLGEFKPDDELLVVSRSGNLKISNPDLNMHFPDDMIILEKLDRIKPVSVIYFNSTKKMFYIKRFEIGVLKGDQKYVEIAKNIQVEIVSTDWKPVIELVFKGKKPLEKENINVDEFIAVKGIKAIGNQLSRKEVKEINILESIPYSPEKKELNEIEVVQENFQDEENNVDDSGSQASFNF